MKLVKIFGVVMAAHAAAFMFIFAIPGCRSGKKPAQPAAAPELGATSPVAAAEGSPESLNTPTSAPAEVAVRFSPTRPGSAAAAEVTAPPPPTTHTVVKGDNLWSIAKKHNVSVKQLAAANKITTDTTLKLGQKLVIPTAAPAGASAAAAVTATAPAAAAAPAPTTVTHTIKAGETLGTIAKRYGVKTGEIATANNIADPTKLRVGQTLKIPGAKAAAAATAEKAPAHTKAPVAEKAPARTAPSAPSRPAPAPAPAPEPAPAAQPVNPVAPAEPSSPIEAAPPPADTPVISIQESGAPSI